MGNIRYQKPTKTGIIEESEAGVLNMHTEQMELVNVDQLVPEKHSYRRLKSLLQFHSIVRAVKVPESGSGATGFGRMRLILCLILQFMEDLSDREMERFLSENNAAKWFCGFSLLEKTPDYTTLCKFRKLVGTKNMSRLFNEVKRQLKARGHCSEVFTFIDATALVSKLSIWEERDKAIEEGYEKLNNEVLPNIKTADPEAKIGAKSAKKFWYGFRAC